MARLNDLACCRAKPGEELHDGANLVLRVGEHRKTWTLVWRQDGRVRKARIGEYPHMGLSAARHAARECMVRVHAGASPLIDPACIVLIMRRSGTADAGIILSL